MRRASVVALAILALAGLPAAGAAKSSSIVRLISITTSARANDRAPKGPSAGDTVFSTSRLLNAVAQFSKPKGAVVGSDSGTLTLLSAKSASAFGVAKLPGGTITFHGITRRVNGADVIPVTAGTGRFAGAQGTLTVTPLNQRELKALNVYRLTLP